MTPGRKEPQLIPGFASGPEPDPDEAGTAAVSREIRFRYEDEPRDCEAAAWDPSAKAVLLFTKEKNRILLYTLPLSGASVAEPRPERAVGPDR